MYVYVYMCVCAIPQSLTTCQYKYAQTQRDGYMTDQLYYVVIIIHVDVIFDDINVLYKYRLFLVFPTDFVENISIKIIKGQNVFDVF